MINSYYKDHEVAEILGISVKSLRNKICSGAPLPKRIEPPEIRNRLWAKKDVHEWLDKYQIS